MKEFMESEELHNPWNVSNLEEFLYYCCPECDCKNKDKEDFVNHVVISHPRAKILIGPEIEIEIEESDESTTLTQCHNSDILEPELGHQQFTTSLVKIDVQDEFQSDFSDPDHDLNNDIIDPLNCDTNIDETQVQQKEPNIETNQEEKSTKRSQRRKTIKTYTEIELNEPPLKKCKNKNFPRKSELTQHINSVHGNIQHTCDICEKNFSYQSNLKKHIKRVHEHFRYNCEKCKRSYSDKFDLKNHIIGFHEKVQIVYDCDKCEKSFARKNALNRHIKSVHENIRYDCDKCEKNFSMKENLNKHIQRIHQNTT